jgi:ABC-type polysaccharide/polyol phosphate export permease
MLYNHSKLDFWSLLRPVSKPRIWFYLAYASVVNEYRRTLLGPVWILLNLMIFALSIGVVYSGLFSIEYFDYIAYMSASMIGWIWASAILVNSGMVYISNSNILVDHPTDKAYLIWSHVMTQLVVFLHQLPFMFFFYAFGKIELNWNMLYIFPSLAILFAINIGAASILSIIVTRYRDFHKILNSLVVIIMVTTPIFWKPEMVTGARQLIYLLNPFYYIVEIIRDPLLGKYPGTMTYMVACILMILTVLLGCLMHKKYSKTIVFRL